MIFIMRSTQEQRGTIGSNSAKKTQSNLLIKCNTQHSISLSHSKELLGTVLVYLNPAKNSTDTN